MKLLDFIAALSKCKDWNWLDNSNMPKLTLTVNCFGRTDVAILIIENPCFKKIEDLVGVKCKYMT